MERVLLLVDDEANITASLLRLLRNDGYRVLKAHSAGEALEILAQNRVGVILSDQRMPGVGGVELLSRVKELYPQTVRMMLTGYTELETVTDAVNRGAIYKFLTKPWEDAMLRANIHEAFRHHELAQEKEKLARDIRSANEELDRLNRELCRLIEEKDGHLERIAHYDELTGLPNRLLFNDRLSQALAHAQRTGKFAALMFLDIDRFKIVNDSLGHPAGDRLLKAVSERLVSCVREGDTVARMGGDEFAFILGNLGEAHDAAEIAQKILHTLAAPFTLEGKEIFVSACVGIGLYPSDGEDATALTCNADAALNHAKGLGRNNCQYYAPDMNAQMVLRLGMESGLRRALEREEFTLHYQPQLDLASGKIVGIEALLRWMNPEKGIVAPAEFIPLLEETGLIVPVGEWVLRRACRQIKSWRELGLPPLRMAVNLSAMQLRQPGLPRIVAAILEECGMEPSLQELELELTESLLMRNVGETEAALRKLHEMGVRLSIDDFGTGYSSLSYLKRFPISTLKIDRSFVCDLASNPDVTAIVAAIIALGHSLGLNVIAEGVETGKQLSLLRAMKCDEMQGYLFSRPVAADEITQLLQKGAMLDSSHWLG